MPYGNPRSGIAHSMMRQQPKNFGGGGMPQQGAWGQGVMQGMSGSPGGMQKGFAGAPSPGLGGGAPLGGIGGGIFGGAMGGGSPTVSPSGMPYTAPGTMPQQPMSLPQLPEIYRAAEGVPPSSAMGQPAPLSAAQPQYQPPPGLEQFKAQWGAARPATGGQNNFGPDINNYMG